MNCSKVEKIKFGPFVGYNLVLDFYFDSGKNKLKGLNQNIKVYSTSDKYGQGFNLTFSEEI